MEILELLKKYEEPEIKVKRFDVKDIILDSFVTTDPSDNDNSDPFDDDFDW